MKRLNEEEIVKLITLAAVLFGGWLRFYPPLAAGFPINDGGMFYTMIEDLAANHFVLPWFTSYNDLSIPYAYPPLVFYAGATLKVLFRLDTLQILRLFPALVSTLAILAFQVMAQQVFPRSHAKAALATAAFALMPRSYSWFVMGGGLTRSFGQLFLLLMLASAIRLYKHGEKRDILTTGLLGGLVVLSHPEATIHAITAAFLFFVFLSRNWKGLLQSLLVALIVITISAPWWATVISRHGLAPILNAGQTGGDWRYGLATFFSLSYSEELLATIITVFGLIGMAYCLFKKEYFLPVWLVVHFITQARSATAVSIYPLALMASIATLEIILPALEAASPAHKRDASAPSLLHSPTTRLFLGAVLLYATISGFIVDLHMARNHLSEESRAAMEWVATHTDKTSRFLVLSEQTDPMLQTNAEWFPALAKRSSLLTLQGREWIWGDQFIEAVDPFREVQACLFQDLACLEGKSRHLGLAYDYIFIQRPDPAQFEIPEDGMVALLLTNELDRSSAYKLVYEHMGVIIYQKDDLQ